jgi:hypothetical protein
MPLGVRNKNENKLRAWLFADGFVQLRNAGQCTASLPVRTPTFGSIPGILQGIGYDFIPGLTSATNPATKLANVSMVRELEFNR